MGDAGGSDREVPRAVPACVGSPMRIGSYPRPDTRMYAPIICSPQKNTIHPAIAR